MSPYSDLVVSTECVEKVVKVLLGMPWLTPMHVGNGCWMGKVGNIKPGAFEFVGKSSPDLHESIMVSTGCDEPGIVRKMCKLDRVGQLLFPDTQWVF